MPRWPAVILCILFMGGGLACIMGVYYVDQIIISQFTPTRATAIDTILEIKVRDSWCNCTRPCFSVSCENYCDPCQVKDYIYYTVYEYYVDDRPVNVTKSTSDRPDSVIEGYYDRCYFEPCLHKYQPHANNSFYPFAFETPEEEYRIRDVISIMFGSFIIVSGCCMLIAGIITS